MLLYNIELDIELFDRQGATDIYVQGARVPHRS